MRSREGDSLDDLQLLELDMATMFEISPSGRILREAQPDGSPGPRLAWLGCGEGNVVRVGHTVSETIARDVLAMTANAPPWFDHETLPDGFDAILARLAPETPIQLVGPGPVFALPNGLAAPGGAEIVSGDTAEGRAWLSDLAAGLWPQPLTDAGFVDAADFWEPWCVALVGGEVAALAFAARLGGQGAELGVYTLEPFRGRGLAAAVTAAWSSMPSLKDRTLFYSTSNSNTASRRVAAKLGLRRVGASLRVT